MKAFEIRTPHSMAEAVALLDRDDPEIRPVGGGTALMLMMKAGFFRPQRLVSLASVEARFRRVSADADGTLRIGAMTRLTELEHSPEVIRHAPVIGRALRRLANVRVRNVATLGGHLAHADPHLDLPPVLVAMAARLTIIFTAGEHLITVEYIFFVYLV
jgi:carbon-monoxide dehydrogenase medium subunit